jgi:hypothetical protein
MRLLFRALPLVALFAALAGCGGDKRASVAGKVTVGGKGPLTGGNIRFVSVSDPNRSGGGLIKPDGTYEVPDAPVGECKVVIDNAHLDTSTNKATGLPGMGAPGGMPGGMKGMPGGMKGMPPVGTAGGVKEADKAKMSAAPKGADIPGEMSSKSETAGQKFIKIDPAFTKPESTTLTFTVEKGANTKDFDVK